MTQEQIDVLNIVQQVLRHVLISVAATDPTKTAALSTMLAAAAVDTRLEPVSCQMLGDLSQGLAVLSSMGQTRQ